jgi:hypothetical protein
VIFPEGIYPFLPVTTLWLLLAASDTNDLEEYVHVAPRKLEKPAVAVRAVAVRVRVRYSIQSL